MANVARMRHKKSSRKAAAKLRTNLRGKRLKNRKPANIHPAETLSALNLGQLGRVFKAPADNPTGAASAHHAAH